MRESKIERCSVTGRSLNGTTYDALPTGRVARMPNEKLSHTAPTTT
jgi:hypothetical protein